MTDERAVQLANLLIEYARESVKEGATPDEVAGWSVGNVLDDIAATTPGYLSHELHDWPWP